MRLLNGYLAAQDLESAMSERSVSVERSEFSKGQSVRRTTGKRAEGALSALDRAERTAARLRDSLGLTPASASRMRLDARPQFDLALAIAALPDERDGDDGDGDGV